MTSRRKQKCVASFLVVYGTSEGQTATVTEQIATTLGDRGHKATPVDVAAGQGDRTSSDFDAVLVGSSIHVGKHQPAIVSFVQEHTDELSQGPIGFFQVSLSSAVGDPDRQAEAAGYVEQFVAETGFHPDRIGLFGGALRYSKFGFLKRLMLKQIAKDATGDTDTSRDYEYTDWDEVGAFTDDFAAFVEGRLGSTAPAGVAVSSHPEPPLSHQPGLKWVSTQTA